jgi:hypothetical protein
MVVTKDKEVFLLDYKTGLHDLNIKTIRELPIGN